MLTERDIQPRGRYFLGRFVPFTRTAGGLHVPNQQDFAGGRLIVVSCGPEVPTDIKPGTRVLISPHFTPVLLSQLDGYKSDDGTRLFLYPCDMVIATMSEAAEDIALVSES